MIFLTSVTYGLGEVWQKFGIYLNKGYLESQFEDKFNFYFLKTKKKMEFKRPGI